MTHHEGCHIMDKTSHTRRCAMAFQVQERRQRTFSAVPALPLVGLGLRLAGRSADCSADASTPVLLPAGRPICSNTLGMSDANQQVGIPRTYMTQLICDTD